MPILRDENLSLSVASAEVPKFITRAGGKIEVTTTSPFTARVHRPNRKERRREGKT